MIITQHAQYYTIALQSGPDFRAHLQLVKALPEKRYVPDAKLYEVPVRARAAVEQLAGELSLSIRQSAAPAEAEEATQHVYEIALGSDAPGTPFAYQVKGIHKGLQLRRFMNGDEQGLGKTIQSCLTIASAQAAGLSSFPCLIICPASLKENWKREWEMWTGKKAIILSDSVKDTWPVYFNTGMAQAFIVNYESLQKFFVLRMPGKKEKSSEIEMKANISLFRSVIVDESHRCKDPSTKQSKLVLRLCHRKEWVILCSGTPVKNRTIELFPQLAIMGRLEQFGGRAGFTRDYCGKDSPLGDLNRKLQRMCYFRREKKDVAKDLPDKLRQQIVCDISTREEYYHAQTQFLHWLQKNGATEKQLDSAMRAEALVQINKLRSISAKGKMDAVEEFIREVLDSGQKLIVFHRLREVGQAICKLFPQAVTINGSNTTESRQAAVDAFQKDPETRLIVCNIQAAGVGITLTASSRVAFVELPDTYADLVQCEDRAHRIGQKNAVMCTYFLGKDTIDEKIFNAIVEKKNIHSAITGATDTLEVSTVDSMSTVDKVLNLFKAG